MNKVLNFKNYSYCFFSRSIQDNKNEYSLNCAFNKGDLEKTVIKNRRIASSFFNNRKIIIPNQVHSNRVDVITTNNYVSKEVDALVTDRKDILLGILTADCAPIIMLGKHYFSIIHAGWRGLINDIILKTVDVMILKGEKVNEIKIFVGPHIMQRSFEVKDDFIRILKRKIKNFDDFILKKNKKIFFNFTELIKKKIFECEISNLELSTEDTYSNPSKFYSHRYCHVNKIKNCGRQISLVGIKNK